MYKPYKKSPIYDVYSRSGDKIGSLLEEHYYISIAGHKQGDTVTQSLVRKVRVHGRTQMIELVDAVELHVQALVGLEGGHLRGQRGDEQCHLGRGLCGGELGFDGGVDLVKHAGDAHGGDRVHERAALRDVAA